MGSALGIMLLLAAGITAFILVVIFVLVPLFAVIGKIITMFFKGIGWLIMHLFEFVVGTLSDVIRFVGSLIAMVVLLPMVPLNVVLGRWSASSHFAQSVKNEFKVGAACVYRAVIRRPLKLVLLDGLLEGVEQRVPEAMVGSPGGDRPGRRVGQFEGYTILGSLRSGGSGAKLYVAEPAADKRRKLMGKPDRVVIKSFAISEGSSLPQIVRESRALECAKQLGHVLDHGMDNARFFYVMPYHPGEHLGVVTRQLHGESSGAGLNQQQLDQVMSHVRDLLTTLSAYHKGGLWHKDVKPENVIVHDGRAHLVDLGLVTPLMSAMTLTTHGTEYFRDPEMVRQALRGVKVHQVDGAKFDIYAVGAVLYFMVENTFPAHGVLSRFVNNSPEALRWIVRRAMTDYNQRYETAGEMLADLNYVMQAGNAFAVKPAELPSMRGAAAPADGPQVVMVNATGMSDGDAVEALHAGSARAYAAAAPMGAAGEAVQGFGVVGGIGANGPFAQVGNFKVDAQGNPLPNSGSTTGRPKLSVTNWWTGQYRVESEAAGAPAGSDTDESRAFREHASAFRHQAANMRMQVLAGTMSARKAAREQVKAARARAKDMRSRAWAHRHRVVDPSRTSVGVVVIALLSIAFLGTILYFSFMNRGSSRGSDVFAMAGVREPGLPVLLVVDADRPQDKRVRSRIDRIIEERAKKGYDVVMDPQTDSAEFRTIFDQWREDSDGPADEALEDVLALKNCYGLLHVNIAGDARKPVRKVTENLIHSEREGAQSRRRLPALPSPPIPTAPAEPYLLVNDHPAKADKAVEARINEMVARYRAAGWNLQVNDDVEVAVRQLLPPGPPDPALPPPAQLGEVLVEQGLGGILRIDARPGDGPPQDRIALSIIRLTDAKGPRSTAGVATGGSKTGAASATDETASSGITTVEVPIPPAEPALPEAPESGANR